MRTAKLRCVARSRFAKLRCVARYYIASKLRDFATSHREATSQCIMDFAHAPWRERVCLEGAWPRTTTHVHARPRTTTHDHARTTTHDHAQPTTHDHARPRTTRTTTHDRPCTSTHDHARPRTTTHDHARPTTHVHTRPRTTTHDRPRPTTHVHARPRTTTHDHARPRKTTHVLSIRRLPYLFGEAVDVVLPCERLNTNFHSVIRLANRGDLGSCRSQLIYFACGLTVQASYRWAKNYCKMLHVLFSLGPIHNANNDVMYLLFRGKHFISVMLLLSTFPMFKKKLVVLYCIVMYCIVLQVYHVTHYYV